MLRLALVLHALVATVLMGIGVTAVLSMGQATGSQILLAAGAGFVLSVPVSWLVAREILKLKQRS